MLLACIMVGVITLIAMGLFFVLFFFFLHSNYNCVGVWLHKPSLKNLEPVTELRFPIPLSFPPDFLIVLDLCTALLVPKIYQS